MLNKILSCDCDVGSDNTTPLRLENFLITFIVSPSLRNLCFTGSEHVQAAKEARYDKEAVMKFFRTVCVLTLKCLPKLKFFVDLVYFF